MAKCHFYLNNFSCAISFRNFQNIQEKIHWCILKFEFLEIFGVFHMFFPKKPRKNRGFEPQISRIVHNSGHRKNQKRKLRGRKNRGFGVLMYLD